jgi:hypothetical protein
MATTALTFGIFRLTKCGNVCEGKSMTLDRRQFLRLCALAGGAAFPFHANRVGAAQRAVVLPLDRESFCVEVAPVTGAAASITDYSGFHYCPAADALLFFGGGHAATPEDVVLRFPIDSLRWSADYPATPKGTMLESDSGLYRHLTQGKFWSVPGAVPPIRPISRHTYSGFIWSSAISRMILPMGNNGTYYGFTNETTGGNVAEYDPETRTWEDTGVAGCSAAQAYCEDPISGHIIAHSAGTFRIYDARRRQWAANLRLNGIPHFGIAANLVYYPPNDRFYYFGREVDPTVRTARVWEYEFDRTNLVPIYRVPKGSYRGEPMETNWRPSPKGGAETAFAYDVKNRLIVGGLVDGTMLAFQPNSDGTGTWLQQPAPGATQQTFHCMDYVPRVNAHFLICEVRGKGKTTFAFRWDPSQARATVDPLGSTPRANIAPPADSLQAACDISETVTLGLGVLFGAQANAHPHKPVHIKGQDTKLVSGGAEGKGIIVTSVDTTLESLDISGATVEDGNGAGVRHEGGALVLTRVALHHCQNGILGPARDTPATVVMKDCKIHDNGTGTGQTHGVYIGRIARFQCINSQFWNTSVGHHVKSRAAVTTIQACEIGVNFDGNESYNVDIPVGGEATISECVLRQGPRTDNPIMVNYGSEPRAYEGGSLRVERCRFESKIGGTGIRNALANVVIQVQDCDFVGVTRPVVGLYAMRNCRLDGRPLPDIADVSSARRVT